jgi:hypothetical protein
VADTIGTADYDETPPALQADTTDTNVWDFNRIGPAIRFLPYSAITVALLLFGSVLVSIVTAVPIDVLKRRAAAFTWIGLPSAVAYPFWINVTLDRLELIPLCIGAFGWTYVFFLLASGITLKRVLSPASKSPDPLSLPIANLVFTALLFAAGIPFLEFGIVPRKTIECTGSESALSICGIARSQVFYVMAAATVLLIWVGTVLPVNAYVITAYVDLRNAIKSLLVRKPQMQPMPMELDTTQQTVWGILAVGSREASRLAGGAILALLTILWWGSSLSRFEVTAVCVIALLSLALYALFRRLQQVQQLLVRNALPSDEVFFAAERVATGNSKSGPETLRAELDVQAIKEAIKNRRRHFEGYAVVGKVTKQRSPLLVAKGHRLCGSRSNTGREQLGSGVRSPSS